MQKKSKKKKIVKAKSKSRNLKSKQAVKHLPKCCVSPSMKSEVKASESSWGRLKEHFGRARAFFVWSLVIAVAFAALTLVGSYYSGGSQTPKSSFLEKLPQAATLSLSDEEDGPITLIATGDILTARHVESKMRALNDYTYPFLKVADFLKSGDITFGNLETPFLPGKNVPTGSMTFRSDAKSVEGLLFAGYDIISIANNHTMNYQIPGLTSTIQELKKAGIAYAGGGKNIDFAHTPAVLKVKGKKIAFYAYNDPNIPPRRHGEATVNKAGIAKMDIEAVKNDVKNTLNYADIVIVSMHAGKEYMKEPTQFQKDFAHAAIDAGASVVIGHHPHWVQGVENYGNGVIFYSLGNFVFDQFFSEDVMIGLVAKITFNPDEERPGVELFPTKIDKGNPQPRFPEGDELARVMQRLGL